jgi:hypothetical protein
MQNFQFHILKPGSSQLNLKKQIQKLQTTHSCARLNRVSVQIFTQTVAVISKSNDFGIFQRIPKTPAA